MFTQITSMSHLVVPGSEIIHFEARIPTKPDSKLRKTNIQQQVYFKEVIKSTSFFFFLSFTEMSLLPLLFFRSGKLAKTK